MSKLTNPYVGPRAFKIGEVLYGREHELRQLRSLLIAERIVLLHSPSGAGKTSLIQAGLVPALREREFNVLPTVRVNLEPPSDLPMPDGFNRYVYSVLVSLEDPLSPRDRLSINELLEISLDDYLRQRSRHQDDPPSDLLIFDQFEEILTAAPADHEGKLVFFNQLGTVLCNSNCWALFAMREDYLGALSPYLRPIPGQLENRYRLALLNPETALQAIQNPARTVGVGFTEEAATKLVDDLRVIQVQQPDGTTKQILGPHIEPVQLQVVCLNLWESLASDVTTITLSDLEKIGNVDQALANYYSATIESVVEKVDVDERTVREWFEYHLTTEGIRSQVLMKTEVSGGLPNKAIQLLINSHLVRSETHAGAIWFELSHDRLIEPIHKSNTAWFNSNASLLQKQATLWIERNRSEGLLLTGDELNEIEKEARNRRITENEQEYLYKCHAAREKKRERTIFGLTIGLIITVMFAVIVVIQSRNTERQTQIAVAYQLVAQAESTIATRSSKQMSAVLLAVRSMQIMPSGEASRVLLNNTLSRAIIHKQLDGQVHSMAYSADGRYVIAGGGNTVLVMDVATGKEIARIKTDDQVNSVSFSPDGKYFIAGCRDSVVIVWDFAASQEVRRLSQDGSVYSAVFSPDGKYIAAGGYLQIRIWETETGKEVRVMETNAAPIFVVVYSPDGRYLASGDGKTLRVWDTINGKNIFQKEYGSPVNAVAISPDGKYVMSGGDDFVARVWNLEMEELVSQVAHLGAVTVVDFSPDGERVLSGGRDNIVRVWNPKTGGEIVHVTHDNSVFVAQFSPTGKSVVSGGSDHTIRVWDARSGKEAARMTHDSLVYAAAFSPDGKQVISGSFDHTIRVWEAQTNAEVARMNHDSRIYSVAFSPDGRYAVSGSSDNTARVWEIATGTELFRMEHDDVVYSTVFSRDGRYVLSGGGSTLFLMDIETRKELLAIKHSAPIFTVAISPDGRYLASGGDDFIAHVWDAKTGVEISHVQHQARVRSVAFSPDGNYVVSGGADSTSRVWEAATGKESARVEQIGEVYSVVFSPNGKYIASGDDRTARVWEALTGKEIARVEHNNFVYSVVFSQDGKYIASGGGWYSEVSEALTGKLVSSVLHDGTVNVVAFSPNGKYVATGDDKSAYVWDAFTGKKIAEMGHENVVKVIVFSPDGKYALSGGVDKTVRVWLWHPDDLIANACATITRNLTQGEWDSFLPDQPYLEICPGLPTKMEPLPTPTP